MARPNSNTDRWLPPASLREKAKINKIMEKYEEAKSGWTKFFDEATTDYKYYLSDQWDSDDLDEAAKRGIPALSINNIKKPVDITSGYQRQNRSDIKAYPIEGGDDESAEVRSRLIKWVMSQRGAEFVLSDAFKDALICGIGWIQTYMEYDLDPFHGEMRIKKESPFNMIPDPHLIEKDFSDCSYLFRHSRVHRDILEQKFPEKAKYIKKLTTVHVGDGLKKDINVAMDLGDNLMVLEYWYRSYENVFFYFLPEEPSNMKEWEGTKADFAAFMQENEDYEGIERNVMKIKLQILIEEQLLVYDGYSPEPMKDFPFIPIMCYYESAFDEWASKLQGLVRPLKDVQNEKNKRRSQIAQAVNTIPHSGWIFDKGAVDDINVLEDSGGSAQLIEINAGKRMDKIPSPEIPAAIITLEQMLKGDMTDISLNSELLGQMMEKGEAGISIQLRQKQGLAGIQEPFDNLSIATRMLGNKIIEVVDTWNVAKTLRILGEDSPHHITKQEQEEIQLEQQQVMKQIEQMQQQYEQKQMEMAEIQQSLESLSLIQGDTEDEAILIEQETEKGTQMLQQTTQQLEGMEQQITGMQQGLQAQAEHIQLEAVKEQMFWKDYEANKSNVRYDCTVDETVNSPTYRLAAIMLISQLGQQTNMEIPPEIILELADIPKETKEKLLSMIEEQKQMQAQMMQEQKQMEQQKLQVEMMKAQAGMSGLLKQNEQRRARKTEGKPKKAE